MKPFAEALRDGFHHVREITDPIFLRSLRSEGIRVDDEGYYSFSFGDKKEYELRVEPIGEEGEYQVALYKNNVLMNEKLHIWIKDDSNQ
jgi:hypothetical protein